MKNKSSSIKFRVIVFGLTIAIIAFAFIHSSIPAEQSSEESGNVLGFLKAIFSFFGIKEGLDDHIVRKAAHFIEFFALGIMMTYCAYSFNKSRPYKYSVHIAAVGLLSALTDETIQLNVVGRSGMITDVWLDFSGVVTGAVLMMILLKIYRKIRKLS